ncbi:NAD(P) transhydrogenase subunit alpha [Acetobacter oeni]|uniref:proton-translocating NAD(P)(+) transhydrogenase n=1 Tax=Acetobacter oeni TaxID=304077 RepID=A0A511XL41_9PROT|nr:NAD(P) transhydrogenase subunit alpha [Acetobacter oeni]MBB3883958.1 NAD(P) transhydrogenase subunit alpha [Acetobacter oeni]NHO19961.1 NAD(P)(+) transhydrogenase (Re/Si-specific) subunit alpha [Acetobacter oeni]GBR05749.1 NAD/NADP transhydrogenase subunit alpha [Acetobacter oeni LMG 21952]GEN63659.1 NAD(P) transhydrogenase subunit alpha [Acetobacter oeni]
MSLKIAAIREHDASERRVALVPDVAARIKRLGCDVALEAGAGVASSYPDASYKDVSIEADRAALLGSADIVLAVEPPPPELVKAMKPGAILISFVYGRNNPDLVKALRDGKITGFAMEQIPRISRAQAMDALSSQATLAGYYSVLLGAVHMPKILPMMTTAVGSLRAAQVLVMGLGVAGLQALATAHRLGAVTEGYDVRPETRDEAHSLGSKFVETGVNATGQGGYARELTADEKAKVRSVLSDHIARADLIVTTAAVPGRRAPRLIDADQIAKMKQGSVIIDLGAEGGGNCEGTKAGEIVQVGPVTIVGPINLPSCLAEQASELYAKNIFNLLQQIIKDGKLTLDMTDEVIAKTLVTYDGKITSDAIRQVVEGPAVSAAPPPSAPTAKG